MPWYQLDDANDPKLDELAKQYNLHPLHIEDARTKAESVKVDTASHYTFAVFKPVHLVRGWPGSSNAVDRSRGTVDGSTGPLRRRVRWGHFSN